MSKGEHVYDADHLKFYLQQRSSAGLPVSDQGQRTLSLLLASQRCNLVG